MGTVDTVERFVRQYAGLYSSAGSPVEKTRVEERGGRLHIITELPFIPDKSRLRALLLAANVANAGLPVGKFVVNAASVTFDVSRGGSRDITDAELEAYVSATLSALKTYADAFAGINDGTLSVTRIL